jgi:hypothetical protein
MLCVLLLTSTIKQGVPIISYFTRLYYSYTSMDWALWPTPIQMNL